MSEEDDLDNLESNLFASLRPSKPKKSTTVKKTQPDSKKKLFDIDDDDLLDLLSDGEDDKEVAKKKKSKGSPDTESKENRDGNGEDNSGEDEAVQFGSYIPTSDLQSTPKRRSQSILKTSNRKSEFSRRRSSVHFSDQSPLPSEPLPPTNVPSTDPLQDDQPALSTLTHDSHVTVSSTPLHSTNVTKSNVPISLTPMSPSVNTTPSTNVPVVSTKPSTNVPVVSAKPSTNMPSTSTNPVTFTQPFTSKLITSPKPVSTGPALSTSETPPQVSMVGDRANDREEPPEEDNNGGSSLLFGSYIPSTTQPQGSRRRRSILGNSRIRETPPTKTNMQHSMEPVTNPPPPSDPLATINSQETEVSLASSMPQSGAPVVTMATQSNTIAPLTSLSVSPVTNVPFLNTKSPVPLSHPRATDHTVHVLSNSAQWSSVAQNSSSLVETSDHSLVGTIFTPRSGTTDLEKELRKCKEQLDLVTAEKEHTLSQLQTLQIKFSEVEREKNALSKSLEEARTSLKNERESQQNENQSKEREINQLKRELEDLFKTKEEQLRKELSDVVEKHKTEVTQLKQEHQGMLSQWKEMLSAEQREKREEIGRLQEQQQRLMESLSSAHSEGVRNNTSLQRMVTEISDGVQQTARQMSEALSKLSSSHPTQQIIEALCDKVAKRQEEWLQPLVLRMEVYLGEKQGELSKEKASLSQLQQSLSSERKAIEEERSKLLTQIQQEREALLKSKEHFFSEQQAWLSDHYTEKHHMMRLQTIANETFTKNQKLESELNNLKMTLDHEKSRLASEQAQMFEKKQELEQDRVKLNHERQAVLNLQQNLKVQSVQVNRTSELAQEVHVEGHQALATAHRMHEELNRRRTELKREQQKLASQKLLEDNINTFSCDHEDGGGHKVSSWLQDDDHTSLVLSQIEASQSLRDLVKEAKQDDETLEEEIHFLHKIKIDRRTR